MRTNLHCLSAECFATRLRTVLALLILFAPPCAPAAMPLNLKGVPTLAPMLAQVTPAVVNISVMARDPAESNSLLQDPFFRRFFNIPDQPRGEYRITLAIR